MIICSYGAGFIDIWSWEEVPRQQVSSPIVADLARERSSSMRENPPVTAATTSTLTPPAPSHRRALSGDMAMLGIDR